MSNISKWTHQSKGWNLSVFCHMCSTLIALSLHVADTFCSLKCRGGKHFDSGISCCLHVIPSFQLCSLSWLVFCHCAPCQVSLAYSSPWVKPGLCCLLHSLHGICSLAEPETKSSCYRRTLIAFSVLAILTSFSRWEKEVICTHCVHVRQQHLFESQLNLTGLETDVSVSSGLRRYRLASCSFLEDACITTQPVHNLFPSGRL